MLSIRAEAYPASAVENIELNVLQSLEVSIFPGASYDLRVRITRNLLDVLHDYFSVDPMADVPQEIKINANSNTLRNDSFQKTPDVGSRQNSDKIDSPSRLSVISASWPRRSGLFTSPSIMRGSVDVNGEEQMLTRRSSNETTVGPRQEGFYFKYLRVGDINVDVSTSGFAFNVDNYKAVVEPFVKRGEVMNWTRFVWELEKHASWSLTYNTAATQFHKIGNLNEIGHWKLLFYQGRCSTYPYQCSRLLVKHKLTMCTRNPKILSIEKS